MTTYTARVHYKNQEFVDQKTVPYIVTLKPGEKCHASPVIKRVPHDENKSGSCILDLPANFLPDGDYVPTSWENDATHSVHHINDVIEVDKDMTFTLLWAGAVPVTYKKGADDPHENDYRVLAKYNEEYKLLPCMFTRENYDFTKWKVIQSGVVDQGVYMSPGEILMPTTDIEAIAQWQSKWSLLGDRMNDPSENNTVIDLKENVTAQEGDKELLVPYGKTVTLNMNGHTLDRNLSAASDDGCVINVKGTLILNGPGTLKGGFSTGGASGIILERMGWLKISGALNITDNGAAVNGSSGSGAAVNGSNGNGASVNGDANGRNIYVPENAKIEVIGALDDAKIGITTQKKPEAGSPVVFTDGLRSYGGKDNFVSDDSSYKVGLNENGEAVLEIPTVIVNGVTGSFNDKIKLNYYLDIPDEVLADQEAYVTLTNDRTKASCKLLIKDAEKVQDKGWKFSILLAAKEAGDDIIAKVFDGKGKAFTIKGRSGEDYSSTGVKYTLMQYFDWLKDDTSSSTAQEKAVGAVAKDYCIAAMIYFDYHAEGLSVSDAVNNVTADMLSGYIAVRSGTLPQGVSIKGISAMLESDNTLRLYYGFKGVQPTDFTFTIDGTPATLSQRSDGMYYLALTDGVYSNKLHNTHTYSITYGTGTPDDSNTYTIEASVLTYARSCANKSGKTESDLGKALYLYNRAAVEAFKR